MYIKTLSTEEAGKVFGWAKSMPCSYNVLQLQNKSSCLTVQEWSCQALKCEFQVFARPVVQRSTCNCQVPQIRKVWSNSSMRTLVNQVFLLVQLLLHWHNCYRYHERFPDSKDRFVPMRPASNWLCLTLEDILMKICILHKYGPLRPLRSPYPSQKPEVFRQINPKYLLIYGRVYFSQATALAWQCFFPKLLAAHCGI